MGVEGEIFDTAVKTVLADAGLAGDEASDLGAKLSAAREQATDAAETARAVRAITRETKG